MRDYPSSLNHTSNIEQRNVSSISVSSSVSIRERTWLLRCGRPLKNSVSLAGYALHIFLDHTLNPIQIIAFVMDNATNNDTLVEAFARRCNEVGISFSSRHARMRCMPHTIHLAALKVSTFRIGLILHLIHISIASRGHRSSYQGRETEGEIPYHCLPGRCNGVPVSCPR